VKTSNEADNSH